MRGKKMSSAKRVWPVTFARASTPRRGTPITRRSFPLAFEALAGVVRESFSFGMGPPECSFVTSSRHLRYGTLLVSDLEHRGFHSFKNLKIAGAAAKISRDCFATLIARGGGVLMTASLWVHHGCWCGIA